MKAAVIGSRSLHIQNIGDYLPEDVTEIISGGAKGTKYVIENCIKNGIPIRVIEIQG